MRKSIPCAPARLGARTHPWEAQGKVSVFPDISRGVLSQARHPSLAPQTLVRNFRNQLPETLYRHSDRRTIVIRAGAIADPGYFACCLRRFKISASRGVL